MQLSTISLALTRLGGLFSPAALFAGGTVAGAWFDPSDLSTMFTTSDGTTPVAMPGLGSAVSVGLMLDKSQGLALGPELVSNTGGPFTSTTGWTANGAQTTVSLDAGRLRVDQTGTGSWGVVSTPLSGLTVGAWYKVVVSISFGAGGMYVAVRNQAGDGANVALIGPFTTSGTYTIHFAATQTTHWLQFQVVNVNGNYMFANSATVKALPGNHAIAFNNTTARPELRARVNLLTYSEDFSNAAWAPTGVTVSANTVVAPDGTTTADTITGDGAVSTHWLTQSNAALASGKTWSICAKAGTNNFIQLIFAGDADPWANFDLSSGVVGATGTNVTATISALGNGWYRCTISTPSSLASSVFVALVNSASAPRNQSVALSTSVHLWGADLRPANIGANVPAYQRIADANTYDTSGFPLYLRFDGIDDSMYTPANLNLSGTDKAAVFAGVRSLSLAATAFIAELSAAFNSNAGTFGVYTENDGTIRFGRSGSVPGLNTANSTARTAPLSYVYAAAADLAGTTSPTEVPVFKLNGVNATSTYDGSGNTGGGNFGTYPLYIGRRNNVTFPFNGQLYSLIIAGSAVSAGNISATEQWVAQRTGIVIP